MSASQPHRGARPDPARSVAFTALRAVNSDGAYANLVLPQLLNEAGLTGRDAAFATELVAGTCRLQGSYDLIIAEASGRSLRSFQPAVLDVLRLGAHQLLSTRIPPHAAVSATVELGARRIGQRVRGLINAVLRRVAERSWHEWLDLLAADRDRHAALALTTAHPEWIVRAFEEVLPAEELEAALLADNISPAVSLAIRPGLCTVDELIAAGATPGRHSPYAAQWTGNPTGLAAIRTGRAGVQDEGSQLVALGLSRWEAPTGWWLDLCAGPGGKSALLQGLAGAEGSRLLANEPQLHRARLVGSALRGYDSQAVIAADGGRPAWRPGAFSRVIADVPCSGLGALRRRPESRWRRDPEIVEELHPLQGQLLRAAIEATAPGGVIAYVTCSPHRRETSEVVEEALSEHPEVSVLPARELFCDLTDAWQGDYLQLWPHRHGTDAMFAAYLRKNPEK